MTCVDPTSIIRADAREYSRHVSPDDARGLIAHPSLQADGPQVWADLGCGDGTFTVALASLLPAASLVHALDTDERALARVPSRHGEIAIATHVGDLTAFPWPFEHVDGVLMANSLHYVRDKASFLDHAAASLRRKRFLLVEYDTTRANAWVPYPLDAASAMALFRSAGYSAAVPLGRRRSSYRQGEIYGMLFS